MQMTLFQSTDEDKRFYYSAAFHLGELAENRGDRTNALHFYRYTIQGIPEHFMASKRINHLFNMKDHVR